MPSRLMLLCSDTQIARNGPCQTHLQPSTSSEFPHTIIQILQGDFGNLLSLLMKEPHHEMERKEKGNDGNFP